MSYSLRLRRGIVGLLVALIAGTVAGSGWLLWPEWQDYQKRLAFERAARQLHAGLDAEDILKKLAWSEHARQLFNANTVPNEQVMLTFYGRSYWYCVYLKLASTATLTDLTSLPSQQIKVFRLEAPDEQYQAQTERARQQVSRLGEVSVRNTPSGPVEGPALPLEGEDRRRAGYIWDFFESITRQGATAPNLRFELIHSDPTAGGVDARG